MLEIGTLHAGLLLADRFRLVRELGLGGLGRVWLAEDMQLDGEQVACKVLRKAYGDDARAIGDLKREVLLTRRLHHEHILSVHTFWESPPYRFLTMDYVDGVDLAAALLSRSEAFSPREVITWARQLAGALDYAHTQGVLHRDVKPANILLDLERCVRLTDFGIARTDHELRGRDCNEQPSGTVRYMSPEQLVGDFTGPPADQYSLAITLYELLSGVTPFADIHLFSQIRRAVPPPIRGLPRPANQVLRRALAKRAAARYANCLGFVRSLERALRDVVALPAPSPEQSPAVPHGDTTVFLPRQDAALHQMRLGAVLIQQGLIEQDTLDHALAAQQEFGERLGTLLVRMGSVTEEAIARALARQLNTDFEPLAPDTVALAPLELVGAEEGQRLRCFPVRRAPGGLVLAMVDPLDLATLNQLEAHLSLRILPVSTTSTALERAWIAHAQLHVNLESNAQGGK